MDFSKKVLLISLLLIIGLVLFLVIIYFLAIYSQSQKTDYRQTLGEKEALLIIDYGQGKERWFKGEVKEGMTVIDALQTSGSAGNFSFTANAHLATLDGISSNQEQQWRCYLNDQEVQEGLDAKMISPKDKILCSYR